jgi:hypothetical protein
VGRLRLAVDHIEIYRLTRGTAGSVDAEDHVANGPDLRIGDADREAMAARLREHYAQGRLTLEEFNERIDAAFAATTQSQLSSLTRDLPRLAAPSAPPPAVAAGAGRERARREHRSGSRGRRSMIPVIIAALTAWLLIADLQLRMFPWPGRLAIFVGIFAAVRWLMRRIWHFGRGGGPWGGGPWGGGGCGRYRGRL